MSQSLDIYHSWFIFDHLSACYSILMVFNLGRGKRLGGFFELCYCEYKLDMVMSIIYTVILFLCIYMKCNLLMTIITYIHTYIIPILKILKKILTFFWNVTKSLTQEAVSVRSLLKRPSEFTQEAVNATLDLTTIHGNGISEK